MNGLLTWVTGGAVLPAEGISGDDNLCYDSGATAAVPLVEGSLARHPTTEMAYKSIPVLQTVIIPTDLLPASLPNHQTMSREGVRDRKKNDWRQWGGHKARKQVLESNKVRQRLGEMALGRHRRREIWTKQLHISLPPWCHKGSLCRHDAHDMLERIMQ